MTMKNNCKSIVTSLNCLSLISVGLGLILTRNNSGDPKHSGIMKDVVDNKWEEEARSTGLTYQQNVYHTFVHLFSDIPILFSDIPILSWRDFVAHSIKMQTCWRMAIIHKPVFLGKCSPTVLKKNKNIQSEKNYSEIQLMLTRFILLLDSQEY